MRLLTWLILFSMMTGGCDDKPSGKPDAAVDADILDGDIADADADVVDDVIDCTDAPICTPWQPDELIPDTVNHRFDHFVCPEPFSPTWQTRTMTDGTFPVHCWVQELSGHFVYLVDLQTFDATRISEPGTWEPYAYNEKLLAGQSSEGKIQLIQWNAQTGVWDPVIGGTFFDAKSPVVGDGFVVFQHNLESDDPNDFGLAVKDLTTNAGMDHLMPPEYAAVGYCAGDQLVSWVEWDLAATEDDIRLFVYEPATKTRKRVVLPAGLGDPAYPSSSGRKVVFHVYGPGCNNSAMDLYIYDFETEEVTPIVQDKWWDSGHAYAFSYPLIIYMDYRVACYGLDIPGDFDLSRSFVVIHDLETGVRRPLAITDSPDYSFDGITITPSYKFIYERHTWGEHQLYMMDLLAAGVVDADGHVIPDPSFPSSGL